MGNFIFGLVVGILLIVFVVGIIAYKYYQKNMKSVIDLKDMFSNELDFGFKDSDLED